MEKKQKLFSADDFDKNLSIGDELVFDKPEIKKLRIDLTWFGTELDLGAFLIGSDGMIHEREDLVYFNSRLRWLPAKPFDDDEFNPLEGRPSTFDKDGANYKNPNKWMEATLPLSSDHAVIGSWDDMDDDDDETEDNEENECGETMHVLLEEVNTSKHKSIVFVAAVAKDRIQKGETFKDARSPIVSIYNAETDELIAQYQLASQFPDKDAVCLGKLVYGDDWMWSFVPMADGYNGGMQKLAIDVFN